MTDFRKPQVRARNIHANDARSCVSDSLKYRPAMALGEPWRTKYRPRWW